MGVRSVVSVPPQPFGKYLLLDRIATGGMAEIYRAQMKGAAGITKPVVIKKILPHYAGNPSFVSMFINEAKIAVGLSHGNIAQIFDFGEVDGEYFLAMELVVGQPLSRVLRRSRRRGLSFLPPAFATFIGLEISKGLHYAHTRVDEQHRPLKIIHRDISPQNVIISYEGQVKIVDFGIAKARYATRNETEAGAVKGKYTYFSPEQARGKELDGRSDIFATGVVLYELLCGTLPFEGRMVDVLQRIVRGQFSRPSAVNPHLPAELERVLMTSLATRREDRYPTAEALREALARYLYASAPAFSTNTLAELMGYLFAEELAAQGRRAVTRPGFVEELARWRRLSLSADQGATPIERGPAGGRRAKEARAAEEDTDREEPSDGRHRTQSSLLHSRVVTALHRLPPRWLFVAIPLLATVLAAGVVVTIGHFGTFSVQLTSLPTGATVRVDGSLSPTTTPLLISDLSSESEHRIEVFAPGHRPWVRVVPPEPGGTLRLHAELERAPGARPAPEGAARP